MRLAFPLILVVVVALIANVGWKTYRFFQLLRPGFSHPILFGCGFAAFIALLISGVVVSQSATSGAGRIWGIAAYIGCGAVFYAVWAVLVAELVHLIGYLTKLIPSPLPARLGLTAGWVVMALVVAVTAGGVINRTYHLPTVHYQVNLPAVPVTGSGADSTDSSGPVRLALISDLHIGLINRQPHLARVFDQVLAADPDVIIIAGDIFDGNYAAIGEVEPLLAEFARLTAHCGVWAVMGNHDAGGTYPQMVDFLRQAGVTLLADEAVTVTTGSGGNTRFTLVGRRDSSPIGGAEERQAVAALTDPNTVRPVVVVDHQPSHLREYAGQADLMLSGHTHRGQIWPVNITTSLMYEVSYGYYQLPDDPLQAIVTSGAGTWGPPLRVGSDCEVVVIDLQIG